MATLAEAFVKVRPDVSKFGPELKTKTETVAASAGKSTGSGFASSFLKATAVLAAGGAVVGFFKGAIAEGTEAQKVGAQTTAVLKSTGNAAGVSAKQVEDLANAISAKTGVDDEAIQSNENLLLTFTNIKNVVGAGNDIFNQATMAVSDMSAALGQDGKSSAIQLGKALQDPIKGVTALQRVGVTFTAQQKEQIKTLVKSGDTLGAQKIILAEVQKEFGGSAAAIATPGEKMNVAWKNLQETVGLKLLPVLSKLAGILIPVFTFIANNLPTVGAFVGTILLLVGALKLWSIWQTIIDEELTFNPIGLVVVAIAALAAGIVYLATKTQFFQTVWHAVWGFFKSVAAWFMDWGKYFLPALGPIGLIALAAIEIYQHWSTVWGFLKKVAGWFAGPFAGFFVSGYHAVVNNALKPIQAAAQGVATWFTKTLPGLFSTAWKAVEAAFHAAYVWIVQKVLAPLVSAFLGFVGTVIHGAATAFGWIPGIGPKLKTAAADFDKFAARVKGALANVGKHYAVNIDAYVKVHGPGGVYVPSAPYHRAMAAGGIVRASAGGTIVRVAEAGKDEAVIPLDGRHGLGGGGGEVHIHLHNSVIASRRQAEDLLVQAYNDAVRNRRIRPVMA